MSFIFFSATLFLLHWQQKVKRILYFGKTNKNNKYVFLYKLQVCIIIFFSLRHFPIVLTAKCKTNLILDKTNKINSLQ